jgi:nucleoside recognition membrane protein YjiH
MNAASTLAFYLCYHPPSFAMKHGSARKREFIKHFDYIGTLILSWGGVLHPWKSAHVICTIVLGAVLVAGFFFWEAYADLKEPLLPMRLLRNRGWNVTVILWALGAAVYYANAILWPSMVATMFASGHSSMWAGALSCLPNCGILFGEYCGAWYKRKTNIQIIVVFIIGAAFLGGKSELMNSTCSIMKTDLSLISNGFQQSRHSGQIVCLHFPRFNICRVE